MLKEILRDILNKILRIMLTMLKKLRLLKIFTKNIAIFKF